jgi:hypothetical protein
MRTFNDYFSGHATEYSAPRPMYPPALRRVLSQLAERHKHTGDVATGNRRATVTLSVRRTGARTKRGSQTPIRGIATTSSAAIAM